MFSPRLKEAIHKRIRETTPLTELLEISSITGLEVDRIVKTKCGLTREALQFFLKFRNERNFTIDRPLDSTKGYFFDLEGMTADGMATGTDHEFIVVHHQSHWWILDSYLGCREFTARPIDPSKLKEAVLILQQRFDEGLWHWLTQCSSTDDASARTSRMYLVITEWDRG